MLCIRDSTAMSTSLIYKIFQPLTWEALRQSGMTSGSDHDRSDGFLHFSTADQLEETLKVHYAEAGSLVLAEVAADGLGGTLRWEESRNGQTFPHLYAPLKYEHVTRHWPLSRGPDGDYGLPDLRTG